MKTRLLFILFLTFTVTSFSQVTYTVNTTDDYADVNLNDAICADKNGNCTFRAAIQNANKTSNKDKIEFNISGTAPFTIEITEAITPDIVQPIIIDGRTQSQYAINHTPVIEISNAFLQYSDGIKLHGNSSGSELYGLCIVNFEKMPQFSQSFGYALVSSTANHIIQSNYIGLRADGKTLGGNSGGGLFLGNLGGHLVGGTGLYQGNVISGNPASGLTFQGSSLNSYQSSNNKIQGNLIGTDATGTLNRGNKFNVQFIDSNNNIIGGDTPEARNVISGAVMTNVDGVNQGGSGMVFTGSQSYDNKVIGNYIGTDITGTQSIANMRGGILLLFGANNNSIGTDVVGEGNIISGNGEYGVYFQGRETADPVVSNSIKGNYIGVDITGNVALPNLIGVMMLTGENTNNTIGGTNPNSKNVISGNTLGGIAILSGKNNQIIGNYIGTNTSGTSAISNNVGVSLEDGDNNVGGTTAGSRNIISGNSTGINISKNSASGSTVKGNYIGLNALGKGALPNGTGIKLMPTSTKSTIGGTDLLARNVISGNTYDGISVLGSSHTIQNNYIGLDATGNVAVPNATGIFLGSTATDIEVGGTDLLKRNIISGNSAYGIEIAGSLNTIQNNYIGTNALGTTAVANYFGVYLRGGNNTIGGKVANSRNIISGNTSGIYISESTTSGSSVKSNYIGLNALGNAALPNKTGIYLTPTATNILIGGTDPLERNIISGNTESGISISGSSHNIQNNYIGLDALGTKALPNDTGIYLTSKSTNTIIGGSDPVKRNIISGNTTYGISILGSDITVSNNYIGLNAAGSGALPNNIGLTLMPTSTNCIIGGPEPAYGNIISGNTDVGLYGSGSTHIIQSNFIGLNPAGNGIIKNGNVGFTFNGTATNTKVSNNTISGNGTVASTGRNVYLFGTKELQFFKNNVGTLPDGNTAVVNIGIGMFLNSASNNIIGGETESDGNIIGNHNSNGIMIISSSNDNSIIYNKIGLGADNITNLGNSASGVFIGGNNTKNTVRNNNIANNANGVVLNGQSGIPTQVTITENSIFNNSVLGIDLVGATANDIDDPDAGVNNLQNSPEISSINFREGNAINITYTVSSDYANSKYPLLIEFFGATNGQGKFFIQSDVYTEHVPRTITINLPTGFDPDDYQYIVATATDADGNTSEFGVIIDATLPTNVFKSNSFKIYPNPVSERLFIQNSNSESYNIKVINVLGKVILTQNNNTSTTALNVSNLSKGFYLVNIENELGKTQTIKFIKN